MGTFHPRSHRTWRDAGTTLVTELRSNWVLALWATLRTWLTWYSEEAHKLTHMHICQPVENTAASLPALLLLLFVCLVIEFYPPPGLLLPLISRSHQARVEPATRCCSVKPVGGDRRVSERQRTTHRCSKPHAVQGRGLLVHVSTSVHSQQHPARLQSAQRSIWIIKLLAPGVGG